ncbi:response regulator transcription factor [Sedimentibacter hydroxybenzoicus DSM 7310]|uniref:Response regulator transcription factor n=1 Tax=Sedimentibacter hydroxybenzoicus DSM 7310 TaxID=1123245 RepID=A0A974BLX2_SEDHY|nr:LytTR family DNA-binding domain-containing protein [Sedimentibacter hydroxybenzoicus]NYB75005.1 response regulator transcription factor [Sedimentibacter hydroxybenzoicus DSM 7310]
MMRIAVCDDAVEICSEIENIILDYDKQLPVDVFYSGETLINYMKDGNRFDLIFLDIEIGKINGVEVGRFIRDELNDHITKIVYISSKSSYDRQLFDVQPLNFLSKPLDRKKIIQNIKLAATLLEKENKTFSFKIGNEIHRLPIKEIIYFESAGRQIKLISTNEVYHFYGRIDSVAEQLFASRFIVPHRSYIVNYDNIKIIEKDSIKMINGDIIPVSRTKTKNVKEMQIKYEEDNIL